MDALSELKEDSSTQAQNVVRNPASALVLVKDSFAIDLKYYHHTDINLIRINIISLMMEMNNCQ